MTIKQIQSALKEENTADGWLFFDFHHRDPVGGRVLGLDPSTICKRRWFYFIPKSGAPLKLVHAIEAFVLDSLPGKKVTYRGHTELHEKLKHIVCGAGVPPANCGAGVSPASESAGTRTPQDAGWKPAPQKMPASQLTIAMQYSPLNNIPMVSLADAGTVELVRSLGVEVVSSANLIARLHSTIPPTGFKLHAEAARKVQAIKDEAFQKIFAAVERRKKLDEYALQQHIVERYAAENLFWDAPPIVAIDAHAANPHFEVSKKNPSVFKKNSRVLLDMWAKVNAPGAIYYDITWCGFVGHNPPARYVELFALATQARDAAINFVREGLAANRTIRGWEVDEACRDVIAAAGLEPHFLHRTGHSIDTECHGHGANIDSLETLDDRAILPNTCFSIEPGIYIDGIGVRTEVSVCIQKTQAQIYGPIQTNLITPG